jgi:hypothetical protein
MTWCGRGGDALRTEGPPFDVHTHVGTRDPSGFSATAGQPLLERLYVYLAAAVEATKRGETLGRLLDLARHCCRVRPEHPHRGVFDSVRELLDRYEHHAPHLATGNQYAPGRDLIATAALIARTPGPPLADL